MQGAVILSNEQALQMRSLRVEWAQNSCHEFMTGHVDGALTYPCLLQHPDLIEKRRKAFADTLRAHLDSSGGNSNHGGATSPPAQSSSPEPASHGRRNGGGLPLSPRPNSGSNSPPDRSKPQQQQVSHHGHLTAAEAAVGVGTRPTPVAGGAAAGVHADTGFGGPLESAGGQVQ